MPIVAVVIASIIVVCLISIELKLTKLGQRVCDGEHAQANKPHFIAVIYWCGRQADMGLLSER